MSRTGRQEWDPEAGRLVEDARREKNWKRWGPYLAERQWGAVREDYSETGACWEYLPHDHARSRAYRWGEDGLMGFTDREGRLCFCVALWNGKDPILKERLFGLTSGEGNHGEDVKELYYYLDATPTYSYLKALYKYPQTEYPYGRLVEENARRDRARPEFEILDPGVFADDRYFDVQVECAKAAPLQVLPTLWFRNTWIWGCEHEGCTLKPRIWQPDPGILQTHHETLGNFGFAAAPDPDGELPKWIFTENESNSRRLWGLDTYTPHVKDAFHDYVIHGKQDAVNPLRRGTKAAALYPLQIPARETGVLKLRFCPSAPMPARPFGGDFAANFAARRAEADAFYARIIPSSLDAEEQRVQRQAYAGLLWSKQFYHYSAHDWLKGDKDAPVPPAQRWHGRNAGWQHLFNRDVISMPDKWEYPWYAAWDLAFHAIAPARIDAGCAKQQLILLLREWYLHPNGQIPAYEFALGDVNPPVHAWACWPSAHSCGRNFPLAQANG